MQTSKLRFLLNNKVVELNECSPRQTLLDYLRLEASLRGTKEGCAEGDCGACTVLVGRLLKGELNYESVNSCIRFMGSLHGCHVVTIESLRGEGGFPHPIQQMMIDFHGAQCGFCTPGIVMSLYAMWLSGGASNRADIERALQGNLCRCTGYAPIIRAAEALLSKASSQNDVLVKEREQVRAKLEELQSGGMLKLGDEDEWFAMPRSSDELAELYAENPDSTIVAGSTDVGLWVTKHRKKISPVIFMNEVDDLATIYTSEDGVTIGANATYSSARDALCDAFPQMEEFWDRIAGQQVRNMGTIGGNIANGSPIGDTPPPFIALDAQLTLRKGSGRRTLQLEDFFIEYGKQDRETGEFVESIFIPKLSESAHFAAYKISKRRDEDISALCGAFNVTVENGIVINARIAFGGMAGTPKRAAHVEDALIGAPWNETTIASAKLKFSDDFQPLTDLRASAEYRLMTAANLLERFYLESVGEAASLPSRYEKGRAA